jgi:hypothetical protein
MPPFQGFIRFRRHQVGKQSSFASNTAATRRLPYRGSLAVDPARTDPDVDVGSLDPVLAPFNGPTAVTGPWEGFAAFDDLPYLYSGGLKGGVTPTGGPAYAWVYQVASLTADDFDYFTDEWGDDVSNDYIISGGGVINTLELAFGEDLSAWTVSTENLYARHQIGTGPTGGLNVDDTPQWMYGADTEVYVDSVYSSIGTTKWTDTVHGAAVRVNNNLDQKRFANGSNTRFQLAGYGRGAREIEVEIVAAKSAAAVAERASLDDTPVPERYIEFKTTSPEIITGSTPWSNSIRFSGYLLSAVDGEIGGNSTITFTYRGRYDNELGYVLRAAVVNTLSTL